MIFTLGFKRKGKDDDDDNDGGVFSYSSIYMLISIVPSVVCTDRRNFEEWVRVMSVHLQPLSYPTVYFSYGPYNCGVVKCQIIVLNISILLHCVYSSTYTFLSLVQLTLKVLNPQSNF